MTLCGAPLARAQGRGPRENPWTVHEPIRCGVDYYFYGDAAYGDTRSIVHAVVIDRAQAGLGVHVLADATPNPAGPPSWNFRRHTVARFESFGPMGRAPLAAINGSFAVDMDGSRGWSDGEPVRPLNLIIRDGVVLQEFGQGSMGDEEYDLAFAPGTTPIDVALLRPGQLRDPANARYRAGDVIGAPDCVLAGGDLCRQSGVRRAKSAIGFGPRYVVFLSSDHGVFPLSTLGIDNYSAGPEVSDVARFFRMWGVTDALLLDGGPSTQIHVAGRALPVNPTLFFLFSGGARHVPSAVGVFGAADHPTTCPAADAGGRMDVVADAWEDARADASGGMDAALDAVGMMDASRGIDAPREVGHDATPGGDATEAGNDAGVRADIGSDGSADVLDGMGGTPRPPTPTLNARIPADVTYHRTYDFTGPDTCTRCSNHPSDPYGTCAPPGFEFDVERRATATTRPGFLGANYFCPYNASGDYYDCYKDYVCTWNADPTTGASCVCPRDREVSPGTPTCRATPGVGIQLTVPPGSPGAYGYNVAVWPYEPSRPAFRVGSNVYLYAQFYLPAGQDVTARPGVDCTPSADPDRDVGGVHVPATAGPGRWHEVLIPLMAPVGDFTTIREGLQNCNGWLQCMNSGIWPPNAGDARGGSCIVSRLEFAGYRDFCDLDRYDLELVVDDCAGCTLSHDLRAGSDWTTGERGTSSGSTMTWRFRGSEVQHNCQLNRQFNVQLPSGEWMIDDRWAPVDPTYGTAILIRKRARWRYMNGSTVVSSVDVGCGMTNRNHDGTGRIALGHHGQLRVAGGRVVASGMPDLPCEGP